jgi:hypothetical protein
MTETNDWEVSIADVVKAAVEKGDTLIVTLPPQSESFPNSVLESMIKRVTRAFEVTFTDKDIRILVVPSGMEVQLIKTSELKDK